MVEFEYKPFEKVIVHEIIKWELPEFIKRHVKPNTAFQWADGIVMLRGVFKSQTPKMVDDETNGIVHWALIEFAEMTELKQHLINEENGATAKINDVSINNVFTDFVRWLRSDSRWFPNQTI